MALRVCFVVSCPHLVHTRAHKASGIVRRHTRHNTSDEQLHLTRECDSFLFALAFVRFHPTGTRSTLRVAAGYAPGPSLCAPSEHLPRRWFALKHPKIHPIAVRLSSPQGVTRSRSTFIQYGIPRRQDSSPRPSDARYDARIPYRMNTRRAWDTRTAANHREAALLPTRGNSLHLWLQVSGD